MSQKEAAKKNKIFLPRRIVEQRERSIDIYYICKCIRILIHHIAQPNGCCHYRWIRRNPFRHSPVCFRWHTKFKSVGKFQQFVFCVFPTRTHPMLHTYAIQNFRLRFHFYFFGSKTNYIRCRAMERNDNTKRSTHEHLSFNWNLMCCVVSPISTVRDAQRSISLPFRFLAYKLSYTNSLCVDCRNHRRSISLLCSRRRSYRFRSLLCKRIVIITLHWSPIPIRWPTTLYLSFSILRAGSRTPKPPWIHSTISNSILSENMLYNVNARSIPRSHNSLCTKQTNGIPSNRCPMPNRENRKSSGCALHVVRWM